jgi:hypothetical protein
VSLRFIATILNRYLAIDSYAKRPST